MKVKVLKKECQADPSQYVWRVGKGCFTIDNTSPSRIRKPCAPDEIRNTTGRCVKRAGKIGQALLGKTKSPRKLKPCAPDEIRNPVSERCVKRSGKIGQQLLSKQKSKSPPKARSPKSRSPKARSPKARSPKARSPKALNPANYYAKSSILPCGYMPGFAPYTCMELPLRDIKYIIGPCSFHYFKYAGRNIYLFGEAHLPLSRTSTKTDMKPSNAIMFAGFVNSLVRQNPHRTYDFMYESASFFEKSQKDHNRLLRSSSPTLTSIYHMFYDCINPSFRRFCPYPNLRTQYVDYRSTVEGKKVSNMWANPAQQISEITKLMSSGKVAKQIAAIKKASVRKTLKSYVTSELLRLFRLQRLHPTVWHPSLIIMDMYGIARMLREFDKKIDKHNSQFKGTSENIIYYAGGLHINSMRDFFTNYLGIPESPVNVVWHQENDANDYGCKSFINLDVGNSALNFF